jgi:DNA-binding response OmpR family regulator
MRILVIDEAGDSVEMLRLKLQHETTGRAAVETFHSGAGEAAFLSTVRTYNPTAIVYNVAPPYERALALLRRLESYDGSDGRVIVVTTTHRAWLQETWGRDHAATVLEKPYDLDRMMALLRGARRD